ncbi:hypothetical protein [Halalkalibacter hemicellulosilyticus]|uniref:Uncharacterized protein n=1 Tax=Halalkalibacter hemicellulosilyticusJCM 9152 TaxID=1236971 RepID=W4QLU1_9BACI|nr:hypothetical protein [Halalkalibacter hemicellulosilyticus]GAE32867.1 hypothetical protein JCM9152_4457 [Halalkalibacter hemicellulosilyticusJCM 9152]
MPEYITIIDVLDFAEFWETLRWILFFISPFIMLGVALFAAVYFISLIVDAVTGKKKNKDDDDYDVYRY